MNIRKYISLLTAAALLCTFVTFAPFARAADENGIFKEADAVITNLAGSFFPQENVTRAQFTAALVTVMQIVQNTDLSDKSGFEFKDVDGNGVYFKEIYAAQKAKIIAGGENFYPDENITFAQAVKMCVCAIGFDAAAEHMGGFPSGYIKAAKRLKITDNIYDGESFSNKDAEILLYNLLCSSFMPSSYKNGAAFFEDSNETYLERLYNISCCDGLVTATNICPGNGGESYKKGYIALDGKVYGYEKDTYGLLGKNVRMFYKKGTSEALFLVEEDNETVEINYEDVSEFSQDKISVEFLSGAKKKNYKTAGARYVYNGKISDVFPKSLIGGDYTKITLLDNNSDGVYEYVFILDYKYTVVGSVQKDPIVISDANGGSENALRLNGGAVLSVYENGSVIEIDDIKSGDVIAAAVSEDLSYAMIQRMSKNVAGVLQERDSEGYVYIGGEKYMITGYAEKNYGDILKIGESYTFLIGLNSDIVVPKGFASKMQYGYLVGIPDSEKRADDEFEVKIYTLSQVMKTYTVKKAKVDSVPNMTADKIKPVLERNVSKLIKFKASEDGYIKVIDTADEVYEYQKPADDEDCLKKYIFTAGASEVKEFTYRSGGQSCMPYFNLSSSVILRVPESGTDEEDFAVLDRTSLISGAKYKFDVYDLTEGGTAGIVVAQDKSVKSRTSYMIEKIRNSNLPNGDTGKVIYAYSSSSYKKLYLSAEAEKQLEKPLNPGDIIQATLTDDANIKFIDLVFDAKTLSPSTKVVSGINYDGLNNISYWYGSLYYTDGVYAYISKTKTGKTYDYSFSNLINVKINTANAAIINRERDEIRPVSAAELKDYKSFGDENCFIVVRLNAQSPMEVYAYEN